MALTVRIGHERFSYGKILAIVFINLLIQCDILKKIHIDGTKLKRCNNNLHANFDVQI